MGGLLPGFDEGVEAGWSLGGELDFDRDRGGGREDSEVGEAQAGVGEAGAGDELIAGALAGADVALGEDGGEGEIFEEQLSGRGAAQAVVERGEGDLGTG